MSTLPVQRLPYRRPPPSAAPQPLPIPRVAPVEVPVLDLGWTPIPVPVQIDFPRARSFGDPEPACPGERVIEQPEGAPHRDDALLIDHEDRGTRQTPAHGFSAAPALVRVPLALEADYKVGYVQSENPTDEPVILLAFLPNGQRCLIPTEQVIVNARPALKLYVSSPDPIDFIDCLAIAGFPT